MFNLFEDGKIIMKFKLGQICYLLFNYILFRYGCVFRVSVFKRISNNEYLGEIVGDFFVCSLKLEYFEYVYECFGFFILVMGIGYVLFIFIVNFFSCFVT